MYLEKDNFPLISIITVVYNDAKGLEKTIKNVLNQSYNNIEYIIIDGGSSDGTIEIIKRYEKFISVWISEQDKGIYDAMNKGIKLAKGNWINFMNARDIFYNKEVLSNIFSGKIYTSNIEVIYGDHLADYQNGYKRKVKIGDQPNFLRKMPFCHQSTFVRLSFPQKIFFDTNYQFAADYQFILQTLENGSQFQYKPLPISIIETGGTAEKNIIKTLKEQREIATNFSKTNLQKIITYLFFSKKIIRAKGIQWIKKNSSARLIQKLTHLKYQLSGH